jgi:hypothetical protein
MQGTILVQESLQLILKGMQRSGTAFSAELGRDQEAFARSPESIVLSDESWRRASLDFFELIPGGRSRSVVLSAGPSHR